MSVGSAVGNPALRVGDVSPQTSLGLFLRQAERFGDRTFVRSWDPRSECWAELSWRQFRDRVYVVAQGLVNAGVKPQDRVLLMSENRVEWLYCDLGIQAAGAVTVPVYANLVPASVRTIAEDSQATVAIVSDTNQGAKFSSMPQPPIVIAMDELERWPAEPGMSPSAEVAERLRNLSPEDIATIAYTSGTSGRPKGAVITHGIVIGVVGCCARAYDIRPDDVILSILPYAHIFERIAAFYFAAILSGAQLTLGRGLERILDDIDEVRPTCMDAVPRLFEKVTQRVEAEVRTRSVLSRIAFEWSMRTARQHVRAANPGWWLQLRYRLADRLVLRTMRDRITGGRLRFFMSGSAPLMPNVEEFFWAIGVPIYQGWGMTEVTCVATCNTVSEHRLGTVGKPLPGMDIRLASDGEIEVRSPGVMKEYHRNPTATAEVMSGGWLRTGDIGQIDKDGFLTITDRKKDLIKTSGGKYVAPQPIEVRLRQDPHIDSAVVVGDGRRYVTALIVANWPLLIKELGLAATPDKLVDEPRVVSIVQKLVDRVNADLDQFERIKYFRILAQPLTVEADELTPSLKVKRRVVQEHHRDLIDEMYVSGAGAR